MIWLCDVLHLRCGLALALGRWDRRIANLKGLIELRGGLIGVACFNISSVWMANGQLTIATGSSSPLTAFCDLQNRYIIKCG